jgi:adenylate cyclase
LTEFQAGWTATPAAALRLSVEAAQQALTLDDTYPDTYHLLSGIYLFLRRHEDAKLAIAKALELSPNHALAKANRGMVLTYASEPEAAISELKQAMRLSPVYPDWFLSELGRAYFQSGRHEEAIAVLSQHLQRNPESGEALVLMTAAASAAGRADQAADALAKFLAPRPNYTLQQYSAGEFYKDPRDLQRVLDALRQAGMRE